MMNTVDLHEESFIVPFQNGVKILAPAQRLAAMNEVHSIKEVLTFPMNVYFQIPGGFMLRCNEEVYISHCVHSLGFSSSKELIGITPEKICKLEYVQRIKTHDEQILQKKRMMVFEEVVMPLAEEISIPLITFKFPCYLEHEIHPIIFGLSISLDNTFLPSSLSLAEKLSMLLNSGLFMANTLSDLNTFLMQRKIGDVYLSSQQMNCLKFALKGMTAKKIAYQLGISYRTVEHHFEVLKHKLKVSSKAALLEKILDHFIP